MQSFILNCFNLICGRETQIQKYQITQYCVTDNQLLCLTI